MFGYGRNTKASVAGTVWVKKTEAGKGGEKGSVDQTIQDLEDFGSHSRRGEKMLEGSAVISSIVGD